MEWYKFKELREKYPEIEPWIVYCTVSKMPQIHAVNVPKSLDNINAHWDKKIVQKPIESWEDLKNPRYSVK